MYLTKYKGSWHCYLGSDNRWSKSIPISCNCKQYSSEQPFHIYGGVNSGQIPRAALLGQKVSTYAFCQILASSPVKGLHQFWFLSVMCESTSFPTALSTECAVIFHSPPQFSQSNRWQMIYHCSFNLHFPNYKWAWTSLHTLKTICRSFCEVLVHIFFPLFCFFFYQVFGPLFLNLRV